MVSKTIFSLWWWWLWVFCHSFRFPHLPPPPSPLHLLTFSARVDLHFYSFPIRRIQTNKQSFPIFRFIKRSDWFDLHKMVGCVRACVLAYICGCVCVCMQAFQLDTEWLRIFFVRISFLFCRKYFSLSFLFLCVRFVCSSCAESWWWFVRDVYVRPIYAVRMLIKISISTLHGNVYRAPNFTYTHRLVN